MRCLEKSFGNDFHSFLRCIYIIYYIYINYYKFKYIYIYAFQYGRIEGFQKTNAVVEKSMKGFGKQSNQDTPCCSSSHSSKKTKQDMHGQCAINELLCYFAKLECRSQSVWLWSMSPKLPTLTRLH